MSGVVVRPAEHTGAGIASSSNTTHATGEMKAKRGKWAGPDMHDIDQLAATPDEACMHGMQVLHLYA